MRRDEMRHPSPPRFSPCLCSALCRADVKTGYQRNAARMQAERKEAPVILKSSLESPSFSLFASLSLSLRFPPFPTRDAVAEQSAYSQFCPRRNTQPRTQSRQAHNPSLRSCTVYLMTQGTREFCLSRRYAQRDGHLRSVLLSPSIVYTPKFRVKIEVFYGGKVWPKEGTGDI